MWNIINLTEILDAIMQEFPDGEDREREPINNHVSSVRVFCHLPETIFSLTNLYL